MFEQIVGLCFNVAFVLCVLIAYITGLKHGKLMIQGSIPKIELNPVKPILKAIEKHKEEKEVKALGDDLTEALGYSKESAMIAVKKERSV
jgi:hypothetical protein